MKVLFVSGYSADRVLQSGRLTEGQAFLPKPFALDALAVKVRELSTARCRLCRPEAGFRAACGRRPGSSRVVG